MRSKSEVSYIIRFNFLLPPFLAVFGGLVCASLLHSFWSLMFRHRKNPLTCGEDSTVDSAVGVVCVVCALVKQLVYRDCC